MNETEYTSEILKLVNKGFTIRDISGILNKSVRSVQAKWYRVALAEKADKQAVMRNC